VPRVEGFTLAELEALPIEELDSLVPDGASLVVRVGTSEILLLVRRDARRLVIEAGHVDGGGEGALPTLMALVHAYARRRQLAEIEWLVHATRCAKPNDRLRELLERRGFVESDSPGGRVLRRLDRVTPAG
jgi:hypothetical protein